MNTSEMITKIAELEDEISRKDELIDMNASRSRLAQAKTNESLTMACSMVNWAVADLNETFNEEFMWIKLADSDDKESKMQKLYAIRNNLIKLKNAKWMTH